MKKLSSSLMRRMLKKTVGRPLVREARLPCARVEGRTLHSARHAMGRHIIEKTGTIAAVQRQLGYKNAAYSMQYARITEQEMADMLEDR